MQRFFTQLTATLIVSFFTLHGFTQKLSQFDRAGLCDLLIDKGGVYHAVFQDCPGNGKPTFIYYTSSVSKGKSWSTPVTLSNDGTGNGSGYARILQDSRGYIYAIWKRYGNPATRTVLQNALIDGPGGYAFGTLFYKVLSGGKWSDQIQLNETEGVQNSWFACVGTQGNVYVGWSQLGSAGIETRQSMWYMSDYLRMAVLNGPGKAVYADLNKPSGRVTPGGPPPPDGFMNLDGYVDANNKIHMVLESQEKDNNNGRVINYLDGQKLRVAYTYPGGQAGLSYNYPAHLLRDENGVDHLVFKPAPASLESEEIWDMNLATNKTTPLVKIQRNGVTIKGFQARQGPGGAMAVVIEAAGLNENTEAYGLFYDRGKWTNLGLTKNAAKENVFYKPFIDYDGYLSSLTSVTKYHSYFTSVGYDPSGKKSLLMNLGANTMSTGGLSTFTYSIIFSPIDK